MIKNLKFLLRAGLIEDETRRKKLSEFVDQTKPGEGPTTGVSTSFSEVRDAPASVEGDWVLIERYNFDGVNSISREIVHLEGQSELKGKMTSEANASTGSIIGYYRQGRLSFTYASTDTTRAGFGTVLLTARSAIAAKPIFTGLLIGTHFASGRIGMLTCPAILAKSDANEEEILQEIPNDLCSR